MKKLLLVLSVLALLTGCTNPNKAKNLLDDLGFTDIEITGYRWFACSKEDLYHTGFIARGPSGKRISGTVCDGWILRNATVRYD
jgi:hypothetical protein